jgi:hypothetical protein
MFEFRESRLAMVNRIFIVALAAAKTEGLDVLEVRACTDGSGPAHRVIYGRYRMPL